MKPIKTILVALIASSALNLQAQEISKKPDFIQKDANGEVQFRGVYTTDDSGYVIRYDLSDGSGKLIKTSLPHYSRDGRLLELRKFNAGGKLEEVIVFIGERMVGLTPEGEKIDKYDDTTVDMQGFLDHLRKR